MQTTITSYHSVLMLFHQATGIPFCIFDSAANVIFRDPVIETMECSRKNLSQYDKMIQMYASSVPVVITSGVCYFALLPLDNKLNIILGPVSSVPLTFHDFCLYNNFMEDTDDLLHLYLIMQRCPLFSLSRFAENISLFLKLVLKKDIRSSEILANQKEIYPDRNMKCRDVKEQMPKYYDINETITFQKQILYHIKNGNIAKIEKAFDTSDFFLHINFGISTIEEKQKFYMIYVSLCCVAALEAGVSNAKAVPLLDSYLSKISSIHSISDLFILCRKISLNYCHLVCLMQHNASSSIIVMECLQYIQDHIQSRITLNDLAAYCNTSVRTVSREFKKYYPVSASVCIMQQKLKEAAFLLTHTNMKLIEISTHLGFSAQSHFTSVFKKQYHCTPQKFRIEHALSHPHKQP